MSRPNSGADWRDWLEGLRRFAGKDADRASEILRILAEAEQLASSYDRLFDVLERLGHQDINATDFDLVQRVDEIATRDLAVQTAFCEAGVIPSDGQPHDVAPLLRMFLPVA